MEDDESEVIPVAKYEQRSQHDKTPNRLAQESRPSPELRAAAARVRVAADRRMGYKTADWIVKLAESSEPAKIR